MPQCPVCATPGAYIGFNSVECRNTECEHFTIFEEPVCPCCGKVGHTPTADVGSSSADASVSVDAPVATPSTNGGGGPGNPYYTGIDYSHVDDYSSSSYSDSSGDMVSP